jgi:hypothetical protein
VFGKHYHQKVACVTVSADASEPFMLQDEGRRCRHSEAHPRSRAGCSLHSVSNCAGHI